MPRIQHIGGIGSLLTAGEPPGAAYGKPNFPVTPEFDYKSVSNGNLFYGYGFVMSPDGTRVIVVYDTGNPVQLHQYNLSTPYDVSTATASTVLSLTGYGSTIKEIVARPDGLRLLFRGFSSYGRVYAIDLATPWNLSGATLTTSNFLAMTNSPTFFAVTPDGLTVFEIVGTNISVWALTSAWNPVGGGTLTTTVSKATAFGSSLPVSGDATNVSYFDFSADGRYLYALINAGNIAGLSYVATFRLDTPYDIFGTKTYRGRRFLPLLTTPENFRALRLGEYGKSFFGITITGSSGFLRRWKFAA